MTAYSYNLNPNHGSGATPDPGMVNVVKEDVSKRNVVPFPETGTRVGEDLQTFLLVKACVKNINYRKNVWIDVQIFDGAGQLIHSDRFALRYLGPAEGNGDFFIFDGKVYQGSIQLPPNYSFIKPEARMLQYQLYYEVNNQVFTDNILHQHNIEDDIVAKKKINYILECRLSKSFLEELPEQAKPVFASAVNWVLFAYSFSSEDEHSLDEIEQMIWNALRKAKSELDSSLYIDIDSVEVHWKTVEIQIFLKEIHDLVNNAGLLGIWAGGAILEGSLRAFGEKIFNSIYERLQGYNMQDIEKHAEDLSSKIARENRCLSKQRIIGGKKVNGRYQYIYKLIGCIVITDKGNKKNPSLTVTIDPFSKEPDEWKIDDC